jgi:glucose-1-phosphate cytidylyltransferase
MTVHEIGAGNSPVQVVILCGGKGTRIADVSQGLPKPLVPIGGMPILWHILHGFATQGYKDFVLCLGHRGQDIEDFFTDPEFGDRSPFPVASLYERCDPEWNITFAYTGEETPTGGRVAAIEKYINGNTFLLTYGDGVADVDIDGLVAHHHAMGRIGTVTGVHAQSQFGLLTIEGNLVTSFTEKPVLPDRINGGFFVFDRRIFPLLSSSESMEEVALKRLVLNGELAVYEHDGFWHSLDTRKDYEALNNIWASGQRPWQMAQRIVAGGNGRTAAATRAAAT